MPISFFLKNVVILTIMTKINGFFMVTYTSFII